MLVPSPSRCRLTFRVPARSVWKVHVAGTGCGSIARGPNKGSPTCSDLHRTIQSFVWPQVVRVERANVNAANASATDRRPVLTVLLLPLPPSASSARPRALGGVFCFALFRSFSPAAASSSPTAVSSPAPQYDHTLRATDTTTTTTNIPRTQPVHPLYDCRRHHAPR